MFSGTLRTSGYSASISGDYPVVNYTQTTTVLTDTSRLIRFSTPNYCPSFTLVAATAWLQEPIGSDLTGTWVDYGNCHGAGSNGHFTAHLVSR